MKAKNVGAANGPPAPAPHLTHNKLLQVIIEHARHALSGDDGCLASMDKRTAAGATAQGPRRPPEYYHGRIDAFAEMIRLCQTLQGF